MSWNNNMAGGGNPPFNPAPNFPFGLPPQQMQVPININEYNVLQQPQRQPQLQPQQLWSGYQQQAVSIYQPTAHLSPQQQAALIYQATASLPPQQQAVPTYQPPANLPPQQQAVPTNQPTAHLSPQRQAVLTYQATTNLPPQQQAVPTYQPPPNLPPQRQAVLTYQATSNLPPQQQAVPTNQPTAHLPPQRQAVPTNQLPANLSPLYRQFQPLSERFKTHLPQQIPLSQIELSQPANVSKKRGRPRKNPDQPPKQARRKQLATQVASIPSSTGGAQFCQPGVASSSYPQSDLPPVYLAHSTSNNYTGAQRNRYTANTNTAGNSNVFTSSPYQNSCTSDTAAGHNTTANQYYHHQHSYCHQQAESSGPFAAPAAPVRTSGPLDRIEAAVKKLDVLNNTSTTTCVPTSSNTTRGISGSFVTQRNHHQPDAYPASYGVSNVHHNRAHLPHTVVGTTSGHIPPFNQNLQPQVQRRTPVLVRPVSQPVSCVPVNRAQHVVANDNINARVNTQNLVTSHTTGGSACSTSATYIAQPLHNIEQQSKFSGTQNTAFNASRKRRKRTEASATVVGSVQCGSAPGSDILSVARTVTENCETLLLNTPGSKSDINRDCSLSSDRTAENLSSDRTTENLSSDRTAGSLSSNRTAGSLSSDRTAENLSSDRTAGSLSSDRKAGSESAHIPEATQCSISNNLEHPQLPFDENLFSFISGETPDLEVEGDFKAFLDSSNLSDIISTLEEYDVDNNDTSITFDEYVVKREPDEVDRVGDCANANNSNLAPSNSSINLALVRENNDVPLQYSRSVGNFGTSLVSGRRAPSTDTSGVAVETEQFFNVRSAGERRSSGGALPTAVQPLPLSSSAVTNFNTTLPITTIGLVSTSSVHPNSIVPGGTNYGNADGDNDDGFPEQFLLKQTHLRKSTQEPYSQQGSPILENIEVNFAEDILEVVPADDQLTNTSPYNIITNNNTATNDHHVPTSDMKYETQSGPPPAQPHMTSTGVEPPHSSQGPGMMVGSSPTDAEGVTVMLPTWNGGAPDYLDQSGIKQSSQGLSDTWDSLLMDQTLDVPQPQIAADRRPLPSFIGYTSHLSINGISGLHYHTIASSAQRSVMPSGSPTQSTNQEYYASVVPDTQEYQEPPVVSSSTPCQQGSQKQQQQHTNNQQHCNQHHHHNHHQQQLPQSTQQIELDIEADIARLISNAIAADTTVSSGGSSANDANSGNDGTTGNGSNGGSSSLVQDQDTASRHTSPWNDIVDWFDTACTTNKHQETNVYTVYSTSSPVQTQQHGSSIPNLLTYSPLLQARLQAGNTEAPSSTSTYPPVSPPGRVSTSGSPDQNLHSSYTAPSHSRKRSRGSQGTQNPAKKAAAAISYSNDASMAGGKEKPVHRCSICSRGFLNKSNIKVHLRTHTGEKPFKCTTCEKTFRQKAHLIKHQQIHKRGSRD